MQNRRKVRVPSTLRLAVSPAKKPKQSGGKGSVASQPGCVFQEKEPPKSKSILRKSNKILGTEAQGARLKRYLTPRKKIRERKVPSQGVVQMCEPHERSLCAPNFEDRSQEETLQQEGCAHRDAWEMAQKKSTRSKKRTKPHSTHLQSFGCYQHHLR